MKTDIDVNYLFTKCDLRSLKLAFILMDGKFNNTNLACYLEC